MFINWEVNMESPFAVARYFINKSAETGVELTPMKLIKLVYLAHGWYLGIKGEALINEEIQAWKYGPVIESLYHAFKRYGNKQIPAEEIKQLPELRGLNISPFLDRIWEVYSKIATRITDAETGGIYEVLAYRKLTDQEAVDYIRAALRGKKKSAKPKKGEKLTIVTLVD
jgi:uncharacterized phage-associated protein